MIIDTTLGSPVIQSPINFTSGGAGDNIIVAGVSGFKIGILQFFFIASATVTLIYKSGSTALTGSLPFVANGAQVQDFIQLPLMCNPGDPFIINVSGIVTLGGTIWFYQAPGVK